MQTFGYIMIEGNLTVPANLQILRCIDELCPVCIKLKDQRVYKLCLFS